MNKNGYFQNIAQDLSEKKDLHIPGESRFARLKKMEYWVRILRSAPQYFVLGMVKDLMDKEHQAELDQKLASFTGCEQDSIEPSPSHPHREHPALGQR